MQEKKGVYLIGLEILSLKCFWNIPEILGVELSEINKSVSEYM